MDRVDGGSSVVAGAGRALKEYMQDVTDRLERVQENQLSRIIETAAACAEALMSERLVWVFGAGHSAMMAMEAYPRIGGIQGFVPMVEPGLLQFTNVVGSTGLEQTLVLERVEGYGRAIHNSYATEKGDVLIIFSSSGIESLPLEMAKVARERGLKTIAVVSDEYSREAAEQRARKIRLAEVVDLAIDNQVPAGDATLDITNLGVKISPVSSILNLAIMNCIAAETAFALLEHGVKPRVFRSPHLGGSAEGEFKALVDDYRGMMGRRWVRQTLKPGSELRES